MTKSNHTPTPWMIAESGDNKLSIFEKDVDDHACGLRIATADAYMKPELNRANAALIVHRVNNWDKLVEALEAYDEALIKNGNKTGIDGIKYTKFLKLKEEALALAKEGK